jgi:hypothetical protein
MKKKQRMEWLLPIQCLLCIFSLGIFLYIYIDKTNEVTQLKLALPQIAKEIKRLHEENNRLLYEIQQFESPIHLIELTRKPEFGHLKYPDLNEVLVVPKEVTE